MPTYLYRCLECDKQFEVQQSFTDPARTTCICDKAAPVKKVFTPVGVTFKGSGFYKTDSRGSGSSSGSSGSSTSEAKPAAAASTTPTSTSSESSAASTSGSTSTSSSSSDS